MLRERALWWPALDCRAGPMGLSSNHEYHERYYCGLSEMPDQVLSPGARRDGIGERVRRLGTHRKRIVPSGGSPAHDIGNPARRPCHRRRRHGEPQDGQVAMRCGFPGARAESGIPYPRCGKVQSRQFSGGIDSRASWRRDKQHGSLGRLASGGPQEATPPVRGTHQLLAFSRFCSADSSFLMLSAAGRFSGMVPPSSLMVCRTLAPTF